MLPVIEHPSIFIGDFNSHHQAWGYDRNDLNGDALYEWLINNDLTLVFNPKDSGTFLSARWNKEYSPDLTFITNASANELTTCSRVILKDFPHSQHRPVINTLGHQITSIKSIPKPRWNFKRANWKAFSDSLDIIVKRIKPTANEYNRFVKAVHSCAKKYIPRGFRKTYTPGWSKECEELYHEYQRTGDHDTGENLLHALNKNRKEKWQETVSNLDFTHSSRKAWTLIRKLGCDPTIETKHPTVNPNTIATRLLQASKITEKDEWTRSVRKTLRKEASALKPNNQFANPFSINELELALNKLKHRKAAGYDGIYPEFLINCGPKTKEYLLKLYNSLLSDGNLPSEFKKAKIIVIKKHGKKGDDPSHYRPISLLSVTYKLFERLIYNRIAPTVDEVLPKEQAGFRPNRSCCEQVVSLTNYIEDGFQKKIKSGAVFVDLTTAYDTVWREGLLLKLIRMIPCQKMYTLMANILSNRNFKIHMGNKESRWRTANNGLPQGSVLAPLLFNIYMSDAPVTKSRKFQFADDMAIVFQAKTKGTCETAIDHDLACLENYFAKWKLKPNPTKTESCYFHLNSRESNDHLQLSFCGNNVEHNNFPKYLGITLDRSLTFGKHLAGLSQKLKTRVNLIQKLASTRWGASSQTLRVAALALVYSTAEYCCPVWSNSAHTNKVDVQLNRAMRLTTGTLQSTPKNWLPVLANIAPPT